MPKLIILVDVTKDSMVTLPNRAFYSVSQAFASILDKAFVHVDPLYQLVTPLASRQV